MSHIQNYYRKLDVLHHIAGAANEGALRLAFQSLLEAIGQEHSLILYAEYPFKTAAVAQLRADGVLIDRLRLVHGWWEAKDEKDNLEREIEAKLTKGYPSDNIIFEDTQTAILFQNGRQVLRCTLADPVQLQRLLDGFFSYQLPSVANFRQARDKFLIELPKVAQALAALLTISHRDNLPFHEQSLLFLQSCQRSIGKQITLDHIDEMLIQHILTDEIFRSVFPASRFHIENHLAAAISNLEGKFFRGETRYNLLQRLDPYFAAIRQAAAMTITAKEKQEFLKQVYEDFYTAYNPKDADKLGVVYTPNEVVRFIIEGCDWLTQKHFNKRLADSGLDILDPCMGTGTFVVDLLDYWRGDKHAIATKFATEIHANEISILPYYLACLNIEQTYYDITGRWKEFTGACFVNTLHNWGFEQTYAGAQTDLFGSMTIENQQRIRNQNDRSIPVIIGNPPYNANQKNANYNNPNEAAPIVDARIKETYLAASTAQKTNLYDPYIRFFRWASDRLGERGIVAFVTNRSYLDSRHADGFRKAIATEFQELWLVDLMSDVRKNPKLSGTKHNIFGIQTGVAIAFLVRTNRLDPTDTCSIHYLSIDDFLSAVEKRRWLGAQNLGALARAGEFRSITPNERGVWLNQPQENWIPLLPLVDRKVKAGQAEQAIFKLYSLGINTSRDEWVYDYSPSSLVTKIRYFIDFYQAEQQRLLQTGKLQQDIESFVTRDIKWTTELTAHLVKGTKLRYHPKLIVSGIYRPFTQKLVYYDRAIVHRTYKQTDIFPIGVSVENLAIGISGIPMAKPFQAMAIRCIPCCDLLEKTQFLPFWVYAKDGTRYDNITEWALQQFQTHYSDQNLSKRAIFNYVYAVLHDPRYREKYALNLKSAFPRIPYHPDFHAWADIGAQLIQLHAYFDQVPPWELTRTDISSSIAPKCRLKANKTMNLIEIDTVTKLENIPPLAWQYQLGTRSALEWVLDQYKEKTPKDPTIRQQFNSYRCADYKEQIITLLGRVCRVSVATMQLVATIQSYEP